MNFTLALATAFTGVGIFSIFFDVSKAVVSGATLCSLLFNIIILFLDNNEKRKKEFENFSAAVLLLLLIFFIFREQIPAINKIDEKWANACTFISLGLIFFSIEKGKNKRLKNERNNAKQILDEQLAFHDKIINILEEVKDNKSITAVGLAQKIRKEMQESAEDGMLLAKLLDTGKDRYSFDDVKNSIEMVRKHQRKIKKEVAENISN